MIDPDVFATCFGEIIKDEKDMRPKCQKFTLTGWTIPCTPAEISKYWNGKVVCTKYAWPDNLFTVGKVYTVFEGVLLDNDGDYYLSRPVKSFEDLIELGRSCYNGRVDFIEYKGMA